MRIFTRHRRSAALFAGQLPAAGQGFTVIELVLVIVVIGILGAIAGPRFFNNHAFSERAYFDEIASALRYAQKVAVASGCNVRVELGANSYSLSQQTIAGGHCDTADTTFPLPVRLSDGSQMAGTAPAGVALSPPLTVVYRANGGTALGADQTIAIGITTLTIEAQSGLVIAQ